MIVLRPRFPPVTHFQTRVLEWGVAGILVSWAIVLAQPDPTMLQPQFIVLHRIASETTWTWVAGGVGVTRLLALWFNGAWSPSPWVRMVSSILSGLFWLAILLGFIASNKVGVGLAIYPWLMAADLYSLSRATHDAKVARMRRASGE